MSKLLAVLLTASSCNAEKSLSQLISHNLASVSTFEACPYWKKLNEDGTCEWCPLWTKQGADGKTCEASECKTGKEYLLDDGTCLPCPDHQETAEDGRSC